MRSFISLLVAALALAAASAWADRNLPTDARRAELRVLEYPYVKLADKAAKLAPGAIIVDENNRRILPVNLPKSANVLYKLDAGGDVIGLWLLSDGEVAALKASKQ